MEQGLHCFRFKQNGIPLAALYSDSYGQWDFAGSVKLGNHFGGSWMPELPLDVQNITQAKQRSYFQFENAAFSVFDPGTAMISLRGSF